MIFVSPDISARLVLFVCILMAVFPCCLLGGSFALFSQHLLDLPSLTHCLVVI